MLSMFSFMPPIAFYVLATTTLVATHFAQISVAETTGAADSRVYVIGGILAFLLAFLGFQRMMEQREEAQRPRVSSHDVLQKLSPQETGQADPDLTTPPERVQGPEADSPLGRIRSRTSQLDSFATARAGETGKG